MAESGARAAALLHNARACYLALDVLEAAGAPTVNAYESFRSAAMDLAQRNDDRAWELYQLLTDCVRTLDEYRDDPTAVENATLDDLHRDCDGCLWELLRGPAAPCYLCVQQRGWRESPYDRPASAWWSLAGECHTHPVKACAA
jgi:hypothetical protein